MRAPDQPEVAQVRALPGVEQHVAGLHVAVDQPALVRGIECVSYFGADPGRALGREWSFALEESAKVGTPDVSHRKVQLSVGLARPVDRDDVGVLGRGGRVGLSDEPFSERGVGGEIGR